MFYTTLANLPELPLRNISLCFVVDILKMTSHQKVKVKVVVFCYVNAQHNYNDINATIISVLQRGGGLISKLSNWTCID